MKWYIYVPLYIALLCILLLQTTFQTDMPFESLFTFNVHKYKYIFQNVQRGLNVTWWCFKHTRLQRMSDFLSLNIASTWSLSLHLVLHHRSSQSNYVTLEVLNSPWGPSISYVIRWCHCISVHLYHANFHEYLFGIHQFKLYTVYSKHLLIYLQIILVGIQKLITSEQCNQWEHLQFL